MNAPPAPPAGRRADLIAAAAAIGLVALAAAVAAVLYERGSPVHASAAPLFAKWLPHVGPGTPAAIAVAALVVWQGPTLAATLPWGRLMAAGYAAAVTWIGSLALVDGWGRGLAGRLTTDDEYLSEIAGVGDVPAMLRGFTGRILDFQPDSWTTHVAGHPPGALLVFVGLDRVGLGGGGPAAMLCVLVGALVVVAVPVTLRALGEETAARAALPFLVLFPGAVWIGASADGLFAGVTTCGVALLAVGLTRRSRIACLAAGALLAFGAYLSYGLLLMAPVAVAVLVLALRRRALPWLGLLWGAVGAVCVVLAFTMAGFWWLDGYHLVVERYYQGVASDRPYGYWLWADLAAVVLCAGPALVVVVRRAGVVRSDAAAVVLPLAALAAIVAADLSGLSKAEVERIWLPFVVWLPAGAVLLPRGDRRGWLMVQALTALLVNHLLLTAW